MNPQIAIKIKIAADGTIAYEVDGVAGSLCDQLTSHLDAALGVTDADKTRKPEYYEIQGQQVFLNT